MICQHCGQTHDAGATKCSVTGFVMSAAGMVGTQVDRYKIERLLGMGGFGAVYRAKHVHTDAAVALKLLKKELGADQSMIDRFMREAKAAGAVGSEHIVGVLDAGVTDGQAFLALELLDGWDLKDLVYREGVDDPKRLVGIVLQVLDALAAAHARGIVHRDMKPANVFVVQKNGRDFVKLLDFGISKMHGEAGQSGLTMTGVAMGTPAYMAPEQFFDARSVDGRSDLYSVAAMLYELLAKRLPFETQSYAELIVKVKTEVPPPLASVFPSLPPQLCLVVDKGLAREREQRWQTAQQMADALRTAAGPGWSPERKKATLPPMPAADSASMMMGKTAPPRQSTPVAPAAAPPLTPASFGPAPVVQPPPAPAPAPAPPVKKKSSTWLWITIGTIVALFGCCTCGGVMQQMKNQPQYHYGDN